MKHSPATKKLIGRRVRAAWLRRQKLDSTVNEYVAAENSPVSKVERLAAKWRKLEEQQREIQTEIATICNNQPLHTLD
jgi:hypothetical protein